MKDDFSMKDSMVRAVQYSKDSHCSGRESGEDWSRGGGLDVKEVRHNAVRYIECRPSLLPYPSSLSVTAIHAGRGVQKRGSDEGFQ